MMNILKFLKLVKEMRVAQITNSDKRELLETKLDKAITEYENSGYWDKD